MKRDLVWTVLLSIVSIGGATLASAATFNSSNFSIEGNIGDSIAGSQTSTNYRLTSGGGESINGTGTGGSYKLGEGYTPKLEKSIQLNVQPNNLGLHLPFDEGTGLTAFDTSANTSRGAFENTPTWTTGKVGGALDLESGSSQRIEVPAVSSFKPTTNLTVEAWINPESITTTAAQKIVSITETGGYALYITGNAANNCAASRVCFAVYAGGAYRFAEFDRALLSNGTWYHLAGTYDGSNVKLYLNGDEEGSSAYSGSPSYSTNAPLCIGGEPTSTDCTSGGEAYDGKLDELKIFSRALTAKEVDAEYDAGQAGNTAGLSLNSINPGTSQTAAFDAVVQTDAPGYNLAISQNNDLTSSSDTIPAVSGSIASPVSWVEGTTKGLGFTLYGTNATEIPGMWASGGSYAALPASSTTFYTRTGYTGGAKDLLNMRLRLDTMPSQPTGDYSNQVTIVGTITP